MDKDFIAQQDSTAVSMDDIETNHAEKDGPTRFRILAAVVALALVSLSVIVVLFL